MMQKKAIAAIALITMLLITATVGCVTPSEASQEPWPYHGQNERSTGRSPYDTSHVDGTVKWSHRIQPRAVHDMQSPIVDEDSNLYIAFESILYSFDSEGELRWETDFDDLRITTSVALGPGNTLYAGSYEGRLYSIDRNNGNVQWYVETGASIRSHPIVTGRNMIYFGNDDGGFFAVDGNQRNIEWNFSVPREVGSRKDIVTSPAIAEDGTIYFGSLNNYVYAMDSDGELKWDFQMNDQVWSSPSIADDGTIYVGDLTGLMAINPTGTERWYFQVEDDQGRLYGVAGSAAIDEDGTIYFGAQDNRTYALYPDGSFKWDLWSDAIFQSSSPAIGADGTIYIGSYDTVFYAINPDRSLEWYYNTSGAIDSSPAIGPDGTVYIANTHGEIYAFTGDETEINWLIIGSIVGIIAAVSVVFVYKKYQEIS